MSTTASKVEQEIAEIPAGNDLPEGWATAQLSGIVCKLVDGSHNPPPKKTEGHPMFSARNIGDGTLLLNEGYRLISGKDFKVEHARTQVAPGDVLLTIVGSIGRSLVVPDDTQAFALQRSVAVMRPLLVDPKFLTYDFRAPNSQAFFRDNGAGTAQKGVYLRTLSNMPVSLAPLHEQHRIVAKIEELFVQVNAARARLVKVSQILKQFRQAVIAAACSGRLTEDWREDHKPGEWEDLTLSDVIQNKPKNGYSARPVNHETPWKVLTLTATTSGSFDGQQFKYFDEPIPKDSPFWLQPDDILVQRGNTIEYVGVPAVYDGPPNRFIYPDLMIRFRSNSRVDTKFLYFVLSWDQTRNYLRDRATGTAGSMPKINQTTLLEVPVRLAPLEEQREIVRRVEALLKLADSIEKSVEKATKRADKLTQAILAKAFRGELVPTEAELARREGREYEPAAQLLARIRNEHAQSGAKTRPPRNRTRLQGG